MGTVFDMTNGHGWDSLYATFKRLSQAVCPSYAVGPIKQWFPTFLNCGPEVTTDQHTAVWK